MQHLTDEQLFDYLDGLSSAEEKKTCQEHMAVCPSCLALYEEYQAIHLQLDTLLLEKPSAEFTDQLVMAWEAESATEIKALYSRRPKVMLWVSLAISSLILAIGVYYIPFWLQVNTALQPTFQWLSFLQSEAVVKTFLLINGLLLLLVIDKLFFKPFFERKHKAITG